MTHLMLSDTSSDTLLTSCSIYTSLSVRNGSLPAVRDSSVDRKIHGRNAWINVAQRQQGAATFLRRCRRENLLL